MPTKKYTNATYSGELKNGKPHGKGTMILKNGNKYDGEWKNGKKDGHGIYCCFNGDRYEGYYKNGKKDGNGTYYYFDGEKYDGEWKNGKKDGHGIYYYFDGEKYDGEWKNGKKDGHGIYHYLDGIIVRRAPISKDDMTTIIEHDSQGKKIKEKTISKDDTTTIIEHDSQGKKIKEKTISKDGTKTITEYDSQSNIRKHTIISKDGTKTITEYDSQGWKAKKTVVYEDGEQTIIEYKNNVAINGKTYYKSMPKNRKDVYLQINENDSKEKFLSKHTDDDFIYTDNKRQDDNIIKPNTDYVHLKISYDDHGASDRSLTKNIDKKLFEKYKKNNLKSIYISSDACYGGFYDESGNNLFNIVKDMKKKQKNKNDNCIGFVSLLKDSMCIVVRKTTNKNGKKGIKRFPARKENTENLSDPNYDKNNDFEYYCIIKENGKNKIYQIPSQLCYWREHLIDTKSQKDPTKTLFDEAFEALKEGKDYKFEAEVILNDGKSTKTKMEITIPSKWGVDKNKVKKVKLNNSSAKINSKDSNIQSQLGE